MIYRPLSAAVVRPGAAIRVNRNEIGTGFGQSSRPCFSLFLVLDYGILAAKGNPSSGRGVLPFAGTRRYHLTGIFNCVDIVAQESRLVKQAVLFWVHFTVGAD